MIDLHTHSTASDGTLTPTELVQSAIDINLTAIAMTDHDTIDGLKEAHQYLQENNLTEQIQLINGIELSTNLTPYDFDIHIVGLFLDLSSDHLTAKLKELLDSRHKRNEKMMTKLQSLGYDISLKILEDTFKDSVITRAHIARYLVDQEYFTDIDSVFKNLLGNGCKGYVAREAVHPKQAIEAITACGGVAILAHPTLYGLDLEGLYRLISSLKQAGLEGIETYYSTYTAQQHEMIKGLAQRFDLCMAGGSDYHGGNKPDIALGVGYGRLNTPDDLLEDIYQRRPL